MRIRVANIHADVKEAWQSARNFSTRRVETGSLQQARHTVLVISEFS